VLKTRISGCKNGFIIDVSLYSAAYGAVELDYIAYLH
jgi:hypothetical protein